MGKRCFPNRGRMLKRRGSSSPIQSQRATMPWRASAPFLPCTHLTNVPLIFSLLLLLKTSSRRLREHSLGPGRRWMRKGWKLSRRGMHLPEEGKLRRSLPLADPGCGIGSRSGGKESQELGEEDLFYCQVWHLDTGLVCLLQPFSLFLDLRWQGQEEGRQ